MFLRDDHSEQQYKFGERVEFLWKDPSGARESQGTWSVGTFVRRCIGEGQESKTAKIKYEHQQRVFETTVELKHVRPDDTKRKKPAMCVFSRHPSTSGRVGLAVAEGLLKALLRDAVGKLSGRSWQGQKKKPCFAFQKGSCNRGSSCPFSHEVDASSPQTGWGNEHKKDWGKYAQNKDGGKDWKTGWKDSQEWHKEEKKDWKDWKSSGGDKWKTQDWNASGGDKWKTQDVDTWNKDADTWKTSGQTSGQAWSAGNTWQGAASGSSEGSKDWKGIWDEKNMKRNINKTKSDKVRRFLDVVSTKII